MARYAAGDDGALAIVYDAVAPRIYAYVLRRLGDASLSEDVMQKTFLHMHRARATFVPGSLVAPWAFSIAKRVLIDAARSRTRHHSRFVAGPDGAEIAEALSSEPDAESHVAARELGERAAALLEKMPSNQRDAFLLMRVDGLSVVEAAEVLGTTVSAVKLRAHRAYKTLADAMGDFNPAWSDERSER